MTRRAISMAPAEPSNCHDPRLSTLVARWRQLAQMMERYAAPVAQALSDCAKELETELRSSADEALSLDRASEASGYSVEHLRRLVSSGAIPNVGQKGRPRIRRGDLPKKPQPATAATLNIDNEARRLANL